MQEISGDPPVKPLIQEPVAGNGLGVLAWVDGEGRRFYDKREAGALVGVGYDALVRRGVPSWRMGRRSLVEAGPFDQDRSEILNDLGAREPSTADDVAVDELVTELEKARNQIAELQSEVAGLASDLRGAAAAEEVWKTAALRRLPSTLPHD